MQERSVPEQLAWIYSQVPKLGHTLVRPPFSDEAIPGDELASRKGFQDLVAFCEEQHRRGTPVRGIITWMLSRFSRADGFATATYWSRLRGVGVRWVITSQRTYDLSDRTDRMLLMIEQEGEAAFSPALAKNVARAKGSRAKNGPVASPPFGYRTVYRETGRAGKREPDHWEIHPEEAPIVRRLFRMYASGKYTLRQIAEELNTEGVPTPSVARNREDACPNWSVTTVKRILTNKRYLGYHIWNERTAGKFAFTLNGEPQERPEDMKSVVVRNDPEQWIVRENAHDELVDLETFELVKQRLANRKQHPGQSHPTRVYVFSGLITCARCGITMAGRVASGIPSYFCRTYQHRGKSACEPNRINEERLLNVLADKLQELFTPHLLPAVEKAIRRELTRSANPDEAADLADLKRRLVELDAKVERHVREMMDADDELKPHIRKVALETKRDHNLLTLRIATLERQKSNDAGDIEATVQKALGAVQQLGEVFAVANRAAIRDFLQDHIERIEVYFDPLVPGQKRERFSRALVFLKDDSPLLYPLCLRRTSG
jgi:DNA invertase Pin-like site-specific DNA recombinase